MMILTLVFNNILICITCGSVFPSEEYYGTTQSIEELSYEYDDDKNSMIAISEKEDFDVYEDFYNELDNWMQTEKSMNIIFFGPTNSFMRLDPETVLHILVHTKKPLIPISRALLAWDMITDGKTAAFLQGREYLAFGTLLNVVPEEDLYYANFGDPSVLGYFSKTNINLYKRKFGVLVAAYRRYFGDLWHQNGSYINELGYLLCGFPSVDLAFITPVVFKEINVNVLSKLDKCSASQTKTLYDIATHNEAYGKPFRWSSHEVARLSLLFTCISEDDISSVQLEAITAITPEVLKLMNQNKLEYFTKQQVLRMSKKSRRIYILRMQLKKSLDMSQLAKKFGLAIKPYVSVLVGSLVTLQL